MKPPQACLDPAWNFLAALEHSWRVRLFVRIEYTRFNAARPIRSPSRAHDDTGLIGLRVRILMVAHFPDTILGLKAIDATWRFTNPQHTL